MIQAIATDSKEKIVNAEAHEEKAQDEKKVEGSDIDEEVLNDPRDEVIKTDVKMMNAEANPHIEKSPKGTQRARKLLRGEAGAGKLRCRTQRTAGGSARRPQRRAGAGRPSSTKSSN